VFFGENGSDEISSYVLKNLYLFMFNSLTGSLESQFSDVEIALLALEDTIDARELQERQLDQRFQVALYQEKRRAEFEELSSNSFN
jgi:hypothetical protein